jgi:hypothetical protein
LKALNSSSGQVRAAQGVFFLSAVIWLAIGIYTLSRMVGRYPGGSLAVWVIGLLMLGNVAAMLAAGLYLGTRRRSAWILAQTILAINILLTITDQFGLLDLATLLIDLVLGGYLIFTRKLYLRSKP